MSLLPPGSTLWLLAHEMRLNWRNFRSGRTGKGPGALIGLGILALMMVAGGVGIAFAAKGWQVPINPLSVAMAAMVCAVTVTLMLSQTLTASTEALYERGDLDLLFSSPIAPRKVLFVRALGVAAGVMTIFAMFLGPLLLPSVIWGHPQWLGLFGVLIALGLTATALGLILAMGLFSLIGPRRTRTVAQVLGALVGAAFFLASQMRTILGGEESRSLYARLVQEAQDGRLKPPEGADIFLRAMVGEPLALLAVLGGAAVLFGLAANVLGRRFSDAAAATQGASGSSRTARARPLRDFARGAYMATLVKELRLIRRDAGLLSQVLLRVLYLIPTAILLTRTAQGDSGLAAMAGGAAVVVFLAGQVTGSLAWITLSAEDSPDLLSVSPAPVRTVRRAKLTAAMIPVAALLAIPIGALIWFDPLVAAWTTAGASLAAWFAGLINIWHQKPCKRTDFRRRRGASWVATLSEVLIAMLISGATGLAVGGFAVWGVIPLVLAVTVLMLMRRTDEQIAKSLRLAA